MSHSLRRPGIDSPNDGGNSQTEAGLGRSEILVVQCPSCRARFALGAEVVAQHEFPRFHCSRCDHVFSYDQVEEQLKNARQASEISQPVEESPRAEVPTLESIEESLLEKPAPSRSIEIPRELPAGHRAAPPHESHEPQIALDFSHGSPLKTSSLDRKNFEFAAKKTEAAKSEFALPENASLLAGDESERRYPSPRTREMRRDNSPSQEDLAAFIERERIAKANEPVIIDSRQTFLIAAAPIVALLLILALISSIADSAPKIAAPIADAVFGQGEAVAPAGLALQNVNFRSLHLESGELVSLISGTIGNSSASKFSDITIEGVLFDSMGSKVASIRSSAASPLGRTRIRSLSPQMIESMQSAPTPKRFELRPGENREVTIAILDHKADDARYFSARIYSVRS